MSERHITIWHVAVIVAEDYGTSLAQMRGASRRSEDVRPRQVAMFLARRLTGQSLPAIGRYFNKDHTTVMHAVRVVTEEASQDHVLAGRLHDLAERINTAEVRVMPGLQEAAEPGASVRLSVTPTRDSPDTIRVIDAVRHYVASRSALALARHTRLEPSARRRADDDFDALASTYREYADARGLR